MADLIIKNIDEKIIEKLRNRASLHGISMEDEVRRIIEQEVSNPTRLGDIAIQYFGNDQSQDLQIPDHKPHQPLQL